MWTFRFLFFLYKKTKKTSFFTTTSFDSPRLNSIKEKSFVFLLLFLLIFRKTNLLQIRLKHEFCILTFCIEHRTGDRQVHAQTVRPATVSTVYTTVVPFSRRISTGFRSNRTHHTACRGNYLASFCHGTWLIDAIICKNLPRRRSVCGLLHSNGSWHWHGYSQTPQA